VLRYPGPTIADSLALDVLNAALSHASVVAYPLQKLEAGSITVTATVPLNLGQNLDMTASDRRITVGYGLSTVPVETANDTALGAGLKGLCVFSFYGVSVAVLVGADNAPAWHV